MVMPYLETEEEAAKRITDFHERKKESEDEDEDEDD